MIVGVAAVPSIAEIMRGGRALAEVALLYTVCTVMWGMWVGPTVHC